MSIFRNSAVVCGMMSLLLLTACTTTPSERSTEPSAVSKLRSTTLRTTTNIIFPPPDLDRIQTAVSSSESAERSRIYRGTGTLVKGQTSGQAAPSGVTPAQTASGPGVSLNFEGAELRDVIKNLLGDILNESYTIDPRVGGSVTIRTTAGIPREALPATLEMLVRMNGATMIKEAGLYRIMPAGETIRGNVTPQLGNSGRPLPPGYSVQIVPLRYVGTVEMLRLLEPFWKDATSVRADDLRNLLILSGTELELRHLMETIEMFDVDWMSGMSAGIFTLQSADVKSVMTELDKVIGDRTKSPLTGILRIIPLERMNALLVITPQPHYLEEAKKWIERLDRGGDESGVRFYVYQVLNNRADALAPLLTQAFTGRIQAQPTTTQPQVAPGQIGGYVSSLPSFTPQASPATPGQPTPAQTAAQIVAQTAARNAANLAAAAAAARGGTADAGLSVVRNVQVVADKDNNRLLVVASPSEYAVIEAALKKLDVPARQVMIDVTIADVQLVDDFIFGVEWYLSSGRVRGGLFSAGTNPGIAGVGVDSTTPTTTAAAGGLPLRVPGLDLAVLGGYPGGIQAVINMLGTNSNVKIISNPHIMALDGQKAQIKVGDRIPILQTTAVGGTVGSVVSTSTYIETGVLLGVTPRVNSGGKVTMDVTVEVSTPGPTSDATVGPAINSRSAQTVISVQSGETMMIGGLITENKESSIKGIPVLSQLPVVGALFGNTNIIKHRNELVIFITPRVVNNQVDAQDVMHELRRKMDGMENAFPGFRSGIVPGGKPREAVIPSN